MPSNCLWHVREKEESRVTPNIWSLSDCKNVLVISRGFEEARFGAIMGSFWDMFKSEMRHHRKYGVGRWISFIHLDFRRDVRAEDKNAYEYK